MSKRQISRRDFMKKTASATLAANAVMLEASSLSAFPQGAAPSDRVRFGIIGVGMQGSGLLRTSIGIPGVECAAACDLYDGRIQLAKEITGKPDLVTTKRYKDLLDNKEIDCIIAAVPDHWHKQIVVDCCNAGKDVYCEKPMTHHVAEGFEMIAAEKKNNRIVQIGSQRRSSIIFNKAKELVAEGKLGDICLVEAGMGRNNPCGAWEYTIPTDLSEQTVDWETWLGSAPKRPFDANRWTRWRCYQDYGEGIPGDLFVHLLTGIHSVMAVTAPPARANSAGGLFRWKDGRDVPDCMTTIYEYPTFRSTLRVTLNTDYDEYTRFMGTKGLLEIHGNWLGLTPQDGEDHSSCTPGWPKKLRDDYGDAWHLKHDALPGTLTTLESTSFFTPPGYNDDREHLGNYFNSVRTRKPSVEDATFGNNTAIGCHMANYSYSKQGTAVWNEASKKITG